MSKDRKELLARDSLWMKSDPKEPNIVLSTRIRLARNLDGWPFPHTLSVEQSRNLEQNLAQVFDKIMLNEEKLCHLTIEELTENERRILVEKHLVSPEFIELPWSRALFLSEDHQISIMVNEEDHLRIQILEPGNCFQPGWQLASAVDDTIEQEIRPAFHEKFGYLTACPTNVGTGLRISVMVHLPALAMLGQEKQVLGALAHVGLAVRGLYGERSQAFGNLYQISNQITLGKTEVDTMLHLEALTSEIVEKELQARCYLKQEARWTLDDRVWRARGILQCARLLSSDEAFELLSLDRLGIELGILPPIAQSYAWTLINCLQGSLQGCSERTLDGPALNAARAGFIRKQYQNIEPAS